jgi:hypothetical protein
MPNEARGCGRVIGIYCRVSSRGEDDGRGDLKEARGGGGCGEAYEFFTLHVYGNYV